VGGWKSKLAAPEISVQSLLLNSRRSESSCTFVCTSLLHEQCNPIQPNPTQPASSPPPQNLIDAGIKSADTVVVGVGDGGGAELEADARVLASLMQVGARRPAGRSGAFTAVLVAL
jgi:hypothetical protein